MATPSKPRKPGSGGARPRSGRAPFFNEPTTTIAFRVPESQAENVRQIVRGYLDGLRSEHPSPQ